MNDLFYLEIGDSNTLFNSLKIKWINTPIKEESINNIYFY